ncbi:MAG TPA: hypothetical protein VLD36_17780 [Burkholderiales bacterium]|nr:hypothetical protein [Burkholderiales bacterium]
MSRDSDRRRFALPVQWLVLDVAGALMLAAGVLGLTGAGARFAPPLGDAQVAWTLVVVGAGLMAIAAVKILGALRARGRG